MDWDDRIRFFDDLDVMEVDFSNATFDDPTTVNAAYDTLERRLGATERKWFFLVDYAGTRIEREAWLSYASRGKRLNLAWSLGSVRYDASPKTGYEIARRAQSEDFDPNLFYTRDAALARIADLRAAQPPKVRQKPRAPSQYDRADFATRLHFHPEIEVMEVDFGDFTFATEADVDAFYDHIEHRIWKTARAWYFLVNLQDCRIFPEAWARYASRGKRVNLKSSLGSVRYDAAPETAERILRHAEDEAFDPNLCPSREAALERIAVLRRSQAG